MSAHLNEIQALLEQSMRVWNSPNILNIPKMESLCELVVNTFRSGNKLAFIGNGGSAAEAMHLAAEFTGKCSVDHPPLNAVCLNESQSSLTAIANDYGPDEIFARLIRASLRKNDVLVALSTSGRSKNIRRAIDESIKLGVVTYLWTGDIDLKSDFPKSLEIWNAPSNSTPRIQEVHLLWGHVLAQVVESKFTED
jgi:D-sedoheptulose 7-phosphate isomerase